MSVVAFDELVRVLRRPPQRLREWEIERVLQEAYRQRVAGIAARRLLETDDGSLDSEQCATLRAVIDRHIDRTQTVVLVAQKIASGLSRHRIPFTFVKGAGFLLLSWTEMRERFIRDLDVLIPPAQFDVTETIFKQLGFVRDPQPRGEEFYRDWHFHMPWRTPSGLVVELHWDLTRRSDPFHIDVLPLCRSVREEQVSHHELPVHELSVALLLSCLQLYQESFLFLNRFVDIDWLARRSSEDDWDRLRGLATRGGMNTLVFAALETSHRLFDTPIPKRVRDRLSPGPVTRAVVRSLALHHHVARPVPIEDLTAEWLPRLWTCPTLVSRVCLLARFLRLDDGYWWDIFHRPRREVSHANRWRARGRRLMTLLQVLLRHVLGLRSGHPSPRGRLPLGDTFAAKKQRPGNEGR